jgi:hypothetical protein
MKIKSIRFLTIPEKLLEKWRKVYTKAFEIEGYSEKYNRFIDECYRYDIKTLWDRSESIARIRR